MNTYYNVLLNIFHLYIAFFFYLLFIDYLLDSRFTAKQGVKRLVKKHTIRNLR